MPVKRWQAEFHGHWIELVNHWSLLPLSTTERLYVDGVVVDRYESDTFSDVSTELSAPLETAGGVVMLRGRIGQRWFGVGGQIFADERQIGGDARITFREESRAMRMARRGVWRFALTRGLPVGLLAALLVAANSSGLAGAGSDVGGAGAFALDVLRYGLPVGLGLACLLYLLQRSEARQEREQERRTERRIRKASSYPQEGPSLR